MRHRYHTVDVFTTRRFGGNPLAVLVDASGLDDAQMQAIAAEFNYSETTFVLPPEDPANTRRVRIFTPSYEMPFAGHPNVGTAFVLAANGIVALPDDGTTVRFEEPAGLVSVRIDAPAGRVTSCEVRAPGTLVRGDDVAPDRVAAALRIDAASVVTANHGPLAAAIGVGFVVVEVDGLETLAALAPDARAFSALPAEAGRRPAVLAYTRAVAGGDVDVRARMFAAFESVTEDPATGSANCVLAALLATLDPAPDGEHALRVGQGVEMGRPSLLHTRVVKRAGVAEEVYVAGTCVPVCAGEIEV